MNRFNVSIAALLAVGMLACANDEPTAPDAGQVRVLFIGNSLTYSNDLPSMVEAVAAAAGANIVAESYALPDYALIDHWNDGLVQQTIRDGNFDFVVLQQGPSSLPLNRDTLRLAAALFAPVIRSAGGVPALFGVWPDVSRYEFFPDVIESYRLAALDVSGVFLPVGSTWVATFNAQPSAPLYGDDGYHPAIAGTYAAAVVMVSVLTHRDPESLSLSVPGVSLEQDLMSTIHSAARSVISSTTLLAR